MADLSKITLNSLPGDHHAGAAAYDPKTGKMSVAVGFGMHASAQKAVAGLTS